MIVNVRFVRGEKKYIQFLVLSKKKEPIIITNATYTLTHNNEVVECGSCEIDGSAILVLLELSTFGSYQLEVTYTIPPEIRKARCVVDVS